MLQLDFNRIAYPGYREDKVITLILNENKKTERGVLRHHFSLNKFHR